MEKELLCPNCGYQLKPEDYYCPSCHHRVDVVVTQDLDTPSFEPVREKVQIAKAIELSSWIYIVSTLLSSAQFVLLSLSGSFSPELTSILAILSLLAGAGSAFYLAGGIFPAARSFRALYYPSLLLFVLGVANIILGIALILIFPSTNTLNTIISQISSGSGIQQLSGGIAIFLTLVGIAGLIGIIGIVGLLLATLRISRILGSKLIRYGLITGVVFSLIEALTGLPVLMLVPPVLFILGAREVLMIPVERM